MSGLPVCPYCDAEVPAHILKAHMAICSDSQRSTPVRPAYLSPHSTAQANLAGVEYYTKLSRGLPTYKHQDALEDAALDALLAPTTDGSQLLHFLMPSYTSARRCNPPPPVTHPRPSLTSSVATALFASPTAGHSGPRTASHDASLTQSQDRQTHSRVSPTATSEARESTRRPSPLEAGHPEATEGTPRHAAVAQPQPRPSEQRIASAVPSKGDPCEKWSTSHAATAPQPYKTQHGSVDRLAFLELICEELRQNVQALQRENRLQQERHDVLEQALYSLLQGREEANQTLSIAAAQPVAPAAAPGHETSHFSDIDLLSDDMCAYPPPPPLQYIRTAHDTARSADSGAPHNLGSFVTQPSSMFY